MMLEDRAGLGSQAVVRAANDLVAAANKDPHFAGRLPYSTPDHPPSTRTSIG